MSNAPATTIRIDPELKADATEVLNALGLSLSAGVTAFLKAVVREQGMPFSMKLDRIAPKSFPGYESDTPIRHQGNSALNKAGMSKRDEFYTQLCDIEAELPHYKEQFFNKTVLCNCDDPFESNFFRFFVVHFQEYHLKKLVTTCYAGSALAGRDCPIDQVLVSRVERHRGAYKAVVRSTDGLSLDKGMGLSEMTSLFSMPGNSIGLLDGDGDFRSPECIALLNEADIIVTNPPFSLFREYIGTLVSSDKKYLIIGNINAVTYKEVFPLIQANKMWLGASIHSGDRKFYVPNGYPLEASGCGVDEAGRRYIRVKGVRWFTNLDTSARHQELALTDTFDPVRYPKYDNYNAINVSRTNRIPFDYSGIMGVPITFLDKYDPEQFKILMLANGNVRANVGKDILDEVGYMKDPNDKGGVGVVNGKRVYARVLIRNMRPRSVA